MTARLVPARPDWLVPGAPVVVYNTDPRNPFAEETTVARIADHTFTVASSVVSAETAREALSGARRRELVDRARIACAARRRDQSTENRLALIAALQVVEDEPGAAE